MTYERSGAIVMVTIRHPERRNAVDLATAHELADAFRRFASDDDASVAVLTGEGGNSAPPGEALAHARELARSIAAFPQACLRMAAFASGETVAGAKSFARGAGRHGDFRT